MIKPHRLGFRKSSALGLPVMSEKILLNLEEIYNQTPQTWLSQEFCAGFVIYNKRRKRGSSVKHNFWQTANALFLQMTFGTTLLQTDLIIK